MLLNNNNNHKEAVLQHGKFQYLHRAKLATVKIKVLGGMRQPSSSQCYVVHPLRGHTSVYVLLLCQLRVSTENSLPIYNYVLQVNNDN